MWTSIQCCILMLPSEPSTDCNPFDISGTYTFNLQDLNLKGMYFAATMQLQQFMEDLTNKWNYQFYLHNWQIMPGWVLYCRSCVMGHQSCTSPKYSCHNNYKLFALYTSWCFSLYIYIYIYMHISRCVENYANWFCWFMYMAILEIISQYSNWALKLK